MSQKLQNIKASTQNPISFKRKKQNKTTKTTTNKNQKQKDQSFQNVICKTGAKGFLLENHKCDANCSGKQNETGVWFLLKFV